MKKAIAMRATREDWDSVKNRVPKEMISDKIDCFNLHNYLVNNFLGDTIVNLNECQKTNNDRTVYETFNAKIFLEACGIEFDKKFEITKEQIIEMASWGNSRDNEKVKEWFPEAFKKELVVGKWYKSLSEYGSLFEYLGNNRVRGFFQGHEWTDDWQWSDDVDVRESTPQEVEPALINEAKKRGLWDNENIICAYSNNSKQKTVNCFICNKDETRLWGENGAIFNNGKWATIIETISKEDAEKLLNKKIV